MNKDQVLNRLLDSGVVAVIRAKSESQLLDIAKALRDGGVLGIEVTMTTPKAIKGIEKLADMMGNEIVVGVGTILEAATCADAIHAGAQFVVSPVFNPAVVETTRRLGRISIPGAYTPTVIITAWSAGADIVKVFPATTLGPGYFKDLLAPMPYLKLTPTGGVDAKTTPEFIKAGAVCVGAGSALVSKAALEKNDWADITAKAKQFADAVKTARASK